MASHFILLYAGILSRTVVSYLYSQLVGLGRLVKIDQIAIGDFVCSLGYSAWACAYYQRTAQTGQGHHAACEH